MASIFQRVVGYGVLIVILYLVYKLIYNWWTKDSEKKKKEEYARTHSVTIQEVTIPMLCEASNEEMKYYKQMEIIDEALNGTSIFNNLTKFNFGTRAMLNMSNKTLVAMNGLAKTIENGIQNKTLSPTKAIVGNILLGYANSKVIPARGAMIPRKKA